MMVIGTSDVPIATANVHIEGIARAQCIWTAVRPQGHGHSAGAIILNGEKSHFAGDDLKSVQQLLISASTVKIEALYGSENEKRSRACHQLKIG